MVHLQAGKTALDKARDNKHKEVALLLARTPQVGICIKTLTELKLFYVLALDSSFKPVGGYHSLPFILPGDSITLLVTPPP